MPLTIARPPGVRIDSGGFGKGLAADLIAGRLRAYRRFAVDCGGDARIGGAGALVEPYDVFVEHPLTGERAYVLRLGFLDGKAGLIFFVLQTFWFRFLVDAKLYEADLREP